MIGQFVPVTGSNVDASLQQALMDRGRLRADLYQHKVRMAFEVRELQSIELAIEKETPLVIRCHRFCQERFVIQGSQPCGLG